MKRSQGLRAAALGVLIWSFAPAPFASAQIAVDALSFGPATLDPVVISGPWTLACTTPPRFEFGNRHVIFASDAVIDTNGWGFRAAKITVSEGAVIRGAVSLGTNAFEPPYDGAVVVAGLIDASGAPGQNGGTIDLGPRPDEFTWWAGGPITLTSTGELRSRAGFGAPLGGRIILTTFDAITLEAGSAPVDTGGGHDQAGGLVSVWSSLDVVSVGREIRTVGGVRAGDIQIHGGFGAVPLSILAPLVASSDGDCTYGPGEGGAVGLSVNDGSIVVAAPINTSASPSCIGTAGDVSITCPGDLTITAALETRGGATLERHAVTIVCGGAYLQTAPLFGAGYDGFATGGRGTDVDIDAGASVTITAGLDVRAGLAFEGPGIGGDVDVDTVGRLEVGSISTCGQPSGHVFLTGGEDVATGLVDTSSVDAWFGFGDSGAVRIEAGRDALLGPIDAHAMSPSLFADVGPVTVTAGRDVSLAGVDAGAAALVAPATYVSVVAARVLETAGPLVYPTFVAPAVDALKLAGCRIRIHAPIRPPIGAVNSGCGVDVTVGDRFVVGALIDAAPSGTVRLKTRLAPTWAPEYDVGGSIVPAPTATLDPTLPPCLALGRAWWSAPASIVSGAPLVVALHGRPQRNVLVGVALSFAHVDLGPLGCSQVDPFAALRLADPGILGPALPGSTTGADGVWTFSTPTSPGLAGLTLVFDGYVFDPQAWNDVFDQPPAAVVTFN